MSPRSHGQHVRKVCGCSWRQWPKCPHPWYVSYKPRHSSKRFRFSLDVELGEHLTSKDEAEKAARTICQTIDGGTFERRADRLRREQREAAERLTNGPAATDTGTTFETFIDAYVNRAA